MPKENVYGSQLPFGEHEHVKGAVQVLWGRETQYVQLVTKCVNHADGSDYEPPYQPPVFTSEQEDDLAAGKVVTTSQPLLLNERRWSGFYVDLDRRGINDLIRNLRRARDQAFGRDE